jgi:hypothetical protein
MHGRMVRRVLRANGHWLAAMAVVAVIVAAVVIASNAGWHPAPGPDNFP